MSPEKLNIPLMSNNITASDKEALIEFIKTSDHFTNGPKAREFEAAWSEWLGVKHSLFVNSGSSANFISMAVLRDLHGAGEVIVPPLTWSSDIASVIAAGLTPVFVDINLANLAMDRDKILAAITPKTKAVFLTHVLGFNGLDAKLLAELDRLGIPLIEDVCESHGARFNGKKCGTFGLASNFSFYYAHHLCTIEGGMICTNDDRFYQYCRLYRSHGLARELTDKSVLDDFDADLENLNQDFMFLTPGYNMRSSDLNAALGLSQLPRLDENNKKRVANFKLFLENLDGGKYFTDFDADGAVNYAFVVMLKKHDPDKLKRLEAMLKAAGVETRKGLVSGNMARQPFVASRYPELNPENLKNADHVHFNALYTGNYPDLEQDKILKLCKILNDFE